MSRAVSQSKRIRKKPETQSEAEFAEPKKLSKYGEWLKAHPNGLEGTYDLRAVMR